jgi:hypothetical protein
MGESPEFQTEQIVGARLAGASVIKTATLLVVSRAAVSKGNDDIHKSWEHIIS